MTDLSTSLDLLELHYQGIHDHLPPSELEIKLIHFESCKRFVLSQIEKYLDDSESDQADVENSVNRYANIIKETYTWSAKTKKLNRHVKEMASGNHKHFHEKDTLAYQIDNLSELALNLLCTPDRNYLVYGIDPFEFLKAKPQVFYVERSLADGIVDLIVEELAGGFYLEAAQEGGEKEIVEQVIVEEVPKEKKKTIRADNVSFLDGLCAKSCLIL